MSMVVWATMWILYLSIVNVGQVWYSFGWESLLLECGFLAIFLGARDSAPPVIVIWMYRWVVFRVMLGAGLIKLRGDPCWRDLTCLSYYFQTQPIPNPVSWWFARLPMAADKAGVLFNYLAELVAPFGCLVPVALVRRSAGIVTILFQLTIWISGNLSWLNWLTIVIAVSCLDDGLLWHLVPVHAGALHPLATPHQLALGALTVLVALLSIQPALNLLSPAQAMNSSFEPLHLVNTYGAFGSVSRDRYEVILEGTTDRAITPATPWREYQFRAKPGDVMRRPPFLAPYHLRLDWLMWFAAIDRGYADPWFLPLVARLLQNDPGTLGLLAPRGNPFPGHPPRWIRAQLYLYRFATPAERRATGAWWSRELVQEYLRPVSLDTPGLMALLQSQGWVR